MVTRGNVAIYCYNALTAKMWDVAESTNGELTSKKTEDTILAKFFSDFVNENGEMKLVEDAKVTLSGATTSEIGSNQVKLEANVENVKGNTVSIADFIEAKKAPRKGKEEVTYKDSSNVVAYVPTTVANIANLAGKTVDVIFGKDNEVAYLVVTDDTLESAYVTAFDEADKEIEIDGTAYDFADTVTVKVFGYTLVKGVEGTKNMSTALTAIKKLLTNSSDDGLGIKDPSKYMTRNVIAETTLNGDDEVETINFKFSADYTKEIKTSENLVVAEYVVEKVSSKNVVTVAGGSMVESDLDDLEEDHDPRVIKNGEVATVYDIEVGDVVTEISYKGKVVTMYVTAETVEGEVADYVAKTNTFEIDGTEYVSVEKPLYNENGEEDDYTQASKADVVYGIFEDEAVTAYLNMAGEVVAMIGESEATGTVLGVVTVDAGLDEDNDDVEYLKLRILAEDGSEKRYSIYNKKSGKDVRDAVEYGTDSEQFELADLKAGAVVRFEADNTRKIKSDKIEVIDLTNTSKEYAFKSNTGLKVEKLTSVGDKTLNGKKFNSSTLVLNPLEEEVISKWEVLTTKTVSGSTTTYKINSGSLKQASGDVVYTDADGNEYIIDPAATNKDVYLFVKGSKVIYVIASVDERAYGASDEQYGILVDVRRDKNEDDETIYVATVLVDGVEKTFECDSSVRGYDYGCFVSFKVTDGEFKNNPVRLVEKDIVDYISGLKDSATLTDLDDYIDETVITYITTSTKLEAIKVDSVEVVDDETYLVFEDESTEDLAKGYIVYNLEDGEMADEINKNDYVILLETDADEDGYDIVIVL